MKNDMRLFGRDRTLVMGLRGDGLVVGISNQSGDVTSVVLPLMAARQIAEWCGAVPCEQPTPAAMLRVCAEALAAYEMCSFQPETSKSLWNRGFDVGSDNCSFAQGDDWCAVYDPSVMEIEVNYLDPDLGLTSAARVSVGTGQVVML